MAHNLIMQRLRLAGEIEDALGDRVRLGQVGLAHQHKLVLIPTQKVLDTLQTFQPDHNWSWDSAVGHQGTTLNFESEDDLVRFRMMI